MTGILNLLMGTVRSAVVTDPYFEYTTLLLPGNGTNGAQNNTFLDGSTNNFTITRNGNTTQGTFSPFSQTGWGNYFDGSGDYLSVASNAAFALGTGDFTIEFWFYPTTGVARNITFPVTGAPIFYMNGSRQLQFETYGAPPSVTTTNTLNLNQWNHCAVSRASGTVKVFVNGVTGVTSTAFSATNFVQSSVNIGTDAGSNFATGYMSNVRITKGGALYTADFTPSTTPLTTTVSAGTVSLLTCQSNRFIDNSTNNFTITRNGDVRVVAFSPFNPTASWSAATYGGSGYFDGNGDSVNAASNAAFAIGTGDFTIEAWIYPISFGTYAYVFGVPVTGGLVFSKEATNFVIRAFNVGDQLQYATLPALNTWTHVAASRSGTTLRMFYNGVQVASTTNSYNFAQGAAYIGNENTNAAPWNGYISNFRLVKGTAVYTGNFTPPTAPITNAGSTSAASYPSTTNVNTSFASSATSLLLNFTNAGIYDATSKNDLETVGYAQISNAVTPKWGSTSIKFDATTGGYLTSNPATTDMYAFGSGDFTIEFWMYISVLGTSVPYDQRTTGGNGATSTLYITSSTLRYYVSGSDRITSSTLSTGQWYHVAVARSGTSTKMFIDGTQAGSTYTDSTVYTNSSLRPFIGGDSNNPGANQFNGYMQDVRITKGYARYTANFTPPTAAFPTL